jgi:hypothetical protein
MIDFGEHDIDKGPNYRESLNRKRLSVLYVIGDQLIYS